MEDLCAVKLQCAGVCTGTVSVQSLDTAGSVGEARQHIMHLTGSCQSAV